MCKDFFRKLTDVCHRLLLDNDNLMYYLKVNREMTDDSIDFFNIGAFPEDLRHLYNRYDLDPKELRENNIIWNASQSQFKLYPIVIPIRNSGGDTIAIGCRTLLSEKERVKIGVPKYRNSSYKKTLHLFGLDCAYEAIREKNMVFVVEGYFDAITAHQKGMRNVVATCGTMFSHKQLAILSRYTNNICLLFDNDDPGRKSAYKIINKYSDIKDVDIKCLFVPYGFKDLDEYLKNGGDKNLFKERKVDLNNISVDTLW